MQDYRNTTTNQFLPVYWAGCQQCTCEICTSRDPNRNSESSLVEPSAEARRPSFTIESLLSRKEERKPEVKPSMEKFTTLNMNLVSSNSATQFQSERSEFPFGSNYLESLRRQSFSMEQFSLLARGNVPTSGRLIESDLFTVNVEMVKKKKKNSDRHNLAISIFWDLSNLRFVLDALSIFCKLQTASPIKNRPSSWFVMCFGLFRREIFVILIDFQKKKIFLVLKMWKSTYKSRRCVSPMV